MKKIKGLLFAFVALFAFTLVMVKANAADVAFGLYNVTTTTNANDTATWDYTGYESAPNSFKNSDVLTGGIIVQNGSGSVKGGVDTNKGSFLNLKSSASEALTGASIYVPVPSATAAGKITVSVIDKYDVRGLVVNDDATKLIYCRRPSDDDYATAASYTFTADDLINLESKYYLKLTSWTSETSGKEIKANGIQIVLTSGAYEASKAICNVNIYDDQELLNSQKVTEGENASYKAIKWGYDFAGFYSDAALTQSIDLASTPITANTDVYTKWTPWPVGTIKKANVIDKDLMKKGFETFGSEAVGRTVELKGQIFSVLGGKTVFQADAKTIEGLGTTTHSLKTNGKIAAGKAENGILLKASGAGKLVVYAKSGSATNRSIDVLGGTSPIKSVALNNTDITRVTLDIPAAGDYTIGNLDGSMVIYHVEFIQPSVNLYQDRVAVGEKENIRLVAVVENVEDLTITNFVLKCDLFASDLDLKAAAKIATRITDNGQTYSSNGISFDVKDGVVYVKCVVELDSKYVGASFTAELTIGGITKTVTINALA